MPAPTLPQVAADPDFLNLPAEERKKVAVRIDPDFARLKPEDQDVVLGKLAATQVKGAPNLESGLRSFLGGLGEHLLPSTGGASLEDVRQMVGQAPPGVGTQIAIGAARTIPPIVGGAVGGLPGALGGGAVGSVLAQEMEQSAGLREGINPWRLAVDTAISAIPGGRFASVTSPAARVALRAAQGAATAGVSGAVTNLSEGVPVTDGMIRNVTLGAGIGGIAGLGEVRRTQAVTAKAIEKAGNQIAIQGPVGGISPPLLSPEEIDQIAPSFEQFGVGRADIASAASMSADELGQRFNGVRDALDAAQAAGASPQETSRLTALGGLYQDLHMRAGQPSPTPEGALFTQRLSIPAQKEAVLSFKQDLAASARALAETDASKAGQRLNRQLAEAIAKSKPGDEYIEFRGAKLHMPSLLKAMNAEGLDPPDVAVQLTQAATTSGQGLNFLSQVQRELNRQAMKDKGLRQVLDSFTDQPQPGLLGKIGRAWIKLDDVRRASLTPKLVTTARNIVGQTGTSLVDAMDKAQEALLTGQGLSGVANVATTFVGSRARSLAENTADVLKFLRVGDPQSLRKISGVLEHFPEQAQELMGTPLAEGALGKYTKALNVLNGSQEKFFRRAGFDMSLRLRLAEAGMNVPEALANPQTIPESMIGAAAEDGLRVTYAGKPEGMFGKAWIDAFHNPVMRPLLTTVNPFPRFMVNAYTFLMDHSPAGYLRLMGANQDGSRVLSDPRYAKTVLARAHTGTMLLAGALALRNNPETRGEKYYKIKLPSGREVDTRPFAPLPQMLFMAEAMRQKLRDGELHFTTSDMAQGILSMNRIAGTGLVAVDLIRQGSMDHKAQLFGDMISQYLGGFTVPAGALGDLLAARDPNEGIYRDTRTDQFTKDIGGLPISAAPAIRNIPKAVGSPFGLPTSQDLPAAASALRVGPLRAEAPAFRQFSGISLNTPTKSEDIIDRLAIEASRVVPATGVPEYDRLTATLMAPVVEQIYPTIMGTVSKKSAAKQRFVSGRVLGSIRDAARRQAAAMRPDLALQAQLKGLDTDLRAVLAEGSGTLPPDVRKVLSKAGIGTAP